MEEIFIGNDNILNVRGLRNELTGVYQNSATVKAQIIGPGGNIGPQTTLSHVASSNGDYRGVLEEDLDLVDQQRCEVVIDVDAGTDLKANWRLKVIALYRRS